MKKRIISILLMACMLLTMLPVTASAASGDTFTAEITVGGSQVDCTFMVLGNPGTVQIGDGIDRAIAQDSTGDLIIPTSVEYGGNRYTVTAIGNNAFNRCGGLTGLSFAADSQLITIGASAFDFCSGLTGDLTIPDSVTTIGRAAFQLCRGFNDTLTLRAGLETIGDFAFSNCSGLTGPLTLPASVTTIGRGAFNDCRGFTGGLTIPANVTAIEHGTFAGCSGLTGGLTIPDRVTDIGDEAFDGCSRLTSITLLSSTAPTLGSGAFGGRYEYSIFVPHNGTDYDSVEKRWFSVSLKIPAYTISGTIKGSDTDSGIPATLQLKNSSNADVGSTVKANASGAYIIPIPVTSAGTGYTIDVSCTGYESGTIPAFDVVDADVTGKDLTLTAIPITITYDANGGSGSMAEGTAAQGAAFTLPANGFTAPGGKQFKAWAIGSADGSQVNPGGAYTFTADITVYAVWEDIPAVTYTITFNANGGSVTPASATTGANGKLATLPVPNRANHRFDGWFTEASGGAQVTTDTVFTANGTIYAQWTYQGGGSDGGSGSSAPAPATDTFAFTPSQLTEMISGNQAIQVENGLQIIAKPEDIPRAEGDTIVIKASEIKSSDSLNAFYIAYPDQQGILKGYSVTFGSENNGQSQEITQLKGEITLKFKLTAEEIKGIDPSTLVVYKQGDNGAVTPLQTAYDWGNNTLSVCTDHLCNFYLMGQKGISAQRLSGANRYETAVAISRQGWAKAESVILASGEDFPDALVATALAGYKDAPVLLTGKDKLTPETLQEIQRLQAEYIYILGGPGVISKGLEDQLAENYKIQRIFGASRYETAVKLGELLQAEKARAKSGDAANTVILATGLNYPDSLSIAPFAGRYGLPILFTGKDTLHEKTADALTDWGIQKVILMGGRGVISENVENTLKELKMSVTRVSGEDRYLTSLAIAQYFETYGADSPNNSSTSDLAKGYTQAALASGESYPDALAGAALAAKEKMPLLLVEKSAVRPEIKEYLKGKQLNKLYVYGGLGAIIDSVKNEISLSRNKKEISDKLSE